jgi:predicted amidohydrolase YtcJ
VGDSTHADLIFRGGDIVTVDPARPEAQALAVKDGRILAVGDAADVDAHAGPGTEIVDVTGKTLLPGFVEAHGHLLWSGMVHGDPVVDIRAMTVPTFDAVLAKIRRRVDKATAGEFLFFFGLDAQLHPGMRALTRTELDEICPDVPLAVQTSNCHAVFANSKALATADITAETPQPTAGVIGKDADGNLNGRLEEAAAFMMCQAFYDHGGDERTRREFMNWIWKYARAGITSATELLFQPYHLPYYEAVVREPDFPLRVRAYQITNDDRRTVQPPGAGDDDFAVVGIKIIADGSPFVGNIWLSRPYLSTEVTVKGMGLADGHTGHMSYQLDALQTLIEDYVALGWQMSVHTQGDRTVDVVLDCYERALEKHPRPDHRFRLEHCATMRQDQIERAIGLGVVSSYFLAHLYYWGQALRDHMLGPERTADYMPIGMAARSGMRMSFHSDAPMTEPDPLLSLQIGVTRQHQSGDVLGPDQRVDIDTAIRAVTLDAAYQIFLDDKVGSLEVGKYADIVVLDRNPRTVPPDEIAAIGVAATYKGGRRAWSVDT